MRQLDHPNVVKLVHFSESRQYYFIVLELCPGGELFHQIVRLTYFSEDLSRHVIVQVAQALEYLHEEAGVVHRWVFRLVNDSLETDVILVISSLRICYSILRPSYRQRTRCQRVLRMRIRRTRVSTSRALVLEESVSSKLPISGCPRSSGTAKL